ncbi:MAG: hypothetical protein ACOZNI_31920 [Myxococcota bacterium]
MTPVPLLLACVGVPEPEGAVPVLAGEGFFGRPFPSDDRLVDDHPDLSGFPGEGDYPLVDDYLAVSTELDGFGTSSPLWLSFEGSLDTSLLPSPGESTQLGSPILLVDVDRDSPHRGELVPLAFEYTDDATSWTPAHFLAAAPVWGFPLRPATTYALVLRSPLVAPGAWEPDWSEDRWRAVEEALQPLGIVRDEVSLAVSFTTQDPLRETARIARAIREEIGRVPLSGPVTWRDSGDGYDLYEGWATVPVWQHGERPYATEGGGFRFDEAGAPIVAFWERTRFAVSVPKGDPPEGGWPVVLYSHGTGGDYLTFAGGSAQDEATVLGREDVAVVGISQPLHGDRATPDTLADLHSFNYLNPEAARANFRQGALDQVYLAALLTAETATFTRDDGGGEVRLDPTRVAYFGHSQGGLVGAIAAPFFSSELVAAGFSGTGGGLSLTIMQRKDPLDIEATLELLLGFEEDEHLSTFHPAIGLIQTLSEVTDPLNYGPWWFAEQPGWEASPIPVLLTEGVEDEMTPADTSEALAVAARVPIVGEPAREPDAMKLRALEPIALPTEGNARDWDDAPITAGLGQFEDVGHFAIYEDRDAKQLYRDFLVSALDGRPILEE